jgi:hypothetical protein
LVEEKEEDFAISYCYNEILLEELNQVFAAFIEE